MRARHYLFFALMGTAFGWLLSRSGAADYDIVQGMFLFERFQLWGIIAVAVAVTAPGLWLLKRRGRSASGSPLHLKPKPRHPGNIVGGANPVRHSLCGGPAGGSGGAGPP